MRDETEIRLRELDHIQAILGRYDQFFFLMKQITILAFGFLMRPLKFGFSQPYGFVALTIIFLLFEWVFRAAYWVPMYMRIQALAEDLNEKDSFEAQLYALNHAADVGLASRLCMSLKLFDVAFYSIFLCVGSGLVMFGFPSGTEL